MPKIIHDLVNKLLRKKDFYPDRPQKERESLAWAIAYKQKGHTRKHKKHASAFRELSACANNLDLRGLHEEADLITRALWRLAQDEYNGDEEFSEEELESREEARRTYIPRKYRRNLEEDEDEENSLVDFMGRGRDKHKHRSDRWAQRAWWENEAGEPMYSPEAIRAEELADFDHEPDYDQDMYRQLDREADEYERLQEKLRELVETYFEQSPDFYPPIEGEEPRDTLDNACDIADDLLAKSIKEDGGIHKWKEFRNIPDTLSDLATQALQTYYKDKKQIKHDASEADLITSVGKKTIKSHNNLKQKIFEQAHRWLNDLEHNDFNYFYQIITFSNKSAEEILTNHILEAIQLGVLQPKDNYEQEFDDLMQAFLGYEYKDWVLNYMRQLGS